MQAKIITRCAMLTAVMLVLGYIESIFVLVPGVPGIKLGLSNTVLLFALYTVGAKWTWLLMLLKVMLSALLFGQVQSMLYALGGGVLSVLIMMFLYRAPHVSVVGVSIAGGVLHIIGQLLVSRLLLGSFVAFSFAPWLLLAAVVSGALTGVAALNTLGAFHKGGLLPKQKESMPTKAPAVVCLGFFDGVHKGHVALIRRARSIADQAGWRVCVHTFDRLPARALGKSNEEELTSADQKRALLLEAGADEVVVSPFDEEMRGMSGEDFFRKIVLDQLQARHVVVGYDHRFGHLGDTDVDKLRTLCEKADIALTVVQPVTLPDGTPVSSTAIRRALAGGDQKTASDMLGRSVDPNPKHEGENII